MAQIAVIERKCIACGVCAQSCPFGAIDLKDGKPEMNAACRVCGICVKACPEKAILKLETRTASVDKTKWKDILVFAECGRAGLHPVSLELIGKARELCKAVPGFKVHALLIGNKVDAAARELLHHGIEKAVVYDDESLSFFRADAYAACAEDCIKLLHPSVVLFGATSLGRSLAPRLSTRFHTGLTADCTRLELRENTDLVQIRPAFGGNIMAQIITTNTRPQFATVRYKVMDAGERLAEASGEIVRRSIPKAALESPVVPIAATALPPKKTISDAEIIVAGGRGLAKESDLELVKRLAAALHGEWAVSRPLVEKGWAPANRQIGLSGRTVKPKLIITCGISGAIQFTACMNGSEHIIAINTDKDAPIFETAHVGVVGDLYEIVPELCQRLEADGHAAL